MAPAVPVLQRHEVLHRYAKQLENPEKYQCQLKSLVQNECVFNWHARGSADGPSEIICLPFKRIFQRCLIEEMTKVNGKKTKLSKWVNIEITDKNTNRELLENDKYSNIIDDFMSASKDFEKWLHHEV